MKLAIKEIDIKQKESKTIFNDLSKEKADPEKNKARDEAKKLLKKKKEKRKLLKKKVNGLLSRFWLKTSLHSNISNV